MSRCGKREVDQDVSRRDGTARDGVVGSRQPERVGSRREQQGLVAGPGPDDCVAGPWRVRLLVASGAWGRLRGLLGRRRPLGLRSGLFLHPCRAVHSCAMAYPIAVWFIGPDGDVLRACRLAPWRWLSCPRAVAVVETHERLLARREDCRYRVEEQARRCLDRVRRQSSRVAGD
ncbi:Uncharacterized ACR, COG1430 [Bordetella trematum]|nr:Uncharacterized ACR, COG1430 [Bordetella trematum]